MSSRSRSCPITYQEPFSGRSAYGIERPLLLLVAVDRPVAELDRALLRDRALELAEAALQLRRVVGIAHLDADRGAGRRRGERPGRAAEREVLQRQPQRLGVREAPFEQEEARLERGQLLVVELELGQEVALGAQRVELLARELVALRVERHAECDELCAVGVEAPRERLVAHLLVALDVRLDVARRQRAPLRHQERDQRELTNQLVGVVAQDLSGRLRRAYAGEGEPSARSRRRLCCARGADATGSSRGSATGCADMPFPCVSLRGSVRRPVERAGLDLLLDEADRGIDALVDRPGDLRLHGDREVAPDVLEERPVRLGEVVRICGEPLHRPLARREHLAAVLELRLAVDVRVDQILDRAIDRSRVLIHAVLNVQDPFVHNVSRSPRL